jgi:hypothetical protein
VLSRFGLVFLCFLLLGSGCVSVPEEEMNELAPSFWGEEEEESPYFRPERVKK